MAKELLKLRMKHGLSLNDVADICGIDVGYVARMELGVPVKLYPEVSNWAAAFPPLIGPPPRKNFEPLLSKQNVGSLCSRALTNRRGSPHVLVRR
jgi:transcriptional regulator with XRE-family HTH domain